MTRYIALLRGINVGGHNVKMDALRTLFEELKLVQVTTYIASGNVIFESKGKNSSKLEQQIEQHLFKALNYQVPTFLRSSAEIEAVALHQPVPLEDLNTAGSSLYVTFLKDAPSDSVQKKVLALQTETDEFYILGREVYWFCRTKISDSPLFKGDPLGKALGTPGTMRNITTVKKLAALYPSIATKPK